MVALPGTVTATDGNQGWYTIHCNQNDAKAYFDGNYIGTITAGELSVSVPASGTHYSHLTVEKDGYYTATQPLSEVPAAGETVNIFITLNPKPDQTSSYGTGSLYVTSTPTGASIHLNNVYQGKAPVFISNLRAGAFSVDAEMEGYDTKKITVTVYSGQTENVHLSLVSPGSLTITSNPSGAFVTINGVTKGKTPITITGLSSNEHEVVLDMNGYYNWRKTIAIPQGTSQTLYAVMKPIDSATKILVSSVPAGASIYLDGVYKGQTMPSQPFPIHDISTGYHTVVLSLSGYQEYTTSVYVKEGVTTTVSAVLGGGSSTPVQTGGNVYITSTPTGADIIIDGKTTAYITPYTVPGLSAGTHTITLKLAGYQEASSTFAIGESGGTVTVILPLAPETGPTKELPGFIWGLAVLSLVIAALGTGKKI